MAWSEMETHAVCRKEAPPHAASPSLAWAAEAASGR